MKKLISLALALALCLSLNISAFAANNIESDIISCDEYYSQVIAEYAKYGIVFEVVSPNRNFQYTKSLLHKRLQQIEQVANSICVSLVASSSPTPELEANSARVMPANYRFTGSIRVKYNLPIFNPFADFEIKCNGKVDLQNGFVMTIDTCTIREDFNVNMDTWDLSVEADVNVPRDSDVTVRTSGSVRFQWTEPNTGTTVRDTVPVNDTFYFRADEYI